MGTVFSGVGLVSGLDIQSLVEGLVQIDARPRDLIQQRIERYDAQRTAYLDVSARLASALSKIRPLSRPTFFRSARGVSSNPDALGVTVNSDALPGSYNFRVQSLATTHQLFSNGLRSRTTELAPGTLTLESAAARVDVETRLDELNGYRGVQRGSFKLIDGAGTEATIDVGNARTVQDVVDRINESELRIQASVRNDALHLTELDGGEIRVREVNGGRVAADLGFTTGNTYSSAGELSGGRLMALSDLTPLSALNDGLGLRRSRGGDDFSIAGDDFSFNVNLTDNVSTTTRLERLNNGSGVDLGTVRVHVEDGGFVDVDLSEAQTLGDVETAIEDAVEGVQITLAGGHLVAGYANSERSGTLRFEDLTGSAAADLGIDQESANGRITGRDLLSMQSVADVIAAINYADGNDGRVTASLGEHGLALNSSAGPLTLHAINGSNALRDLGLPSGASNQSTINGRRIIGGIDTVLLQSLNGGRGFELGELILESDAGSVTVDLSSAETLNDVVSQLRDAAADNALGVDVRFDSTGTRLLLTTDETGGEVSLRDVSGNFAQTLGLTEPAAVLRSTNLQRQYINESTALADLNGGRGVATGSFRITDSTGQSATIHIGPETATLRSVIDAINAANVNVTARINDTGDGLLLVDDADGAGELTVEAETGTSARDLNLLGGATDGVIDGSYELRVDVSGGMTLDDLIDRINQRSPLAEAGIINDGSDVNPYHLSITSTQTGSAGELIVDTTDMPDLGFSELSRAQDARVVLGGSGSSGVVLTSQTNTFVNAVPGLTLDVAQVSDDPITVTVDRDLENIISAIEGFVSAYNTANDRISEVGSYDLESERRGVLLGEGPILTIQRRVSRLITGTIPGATGELRRLSQVGLRLRDGELTFDATEFREAYEANPTAVADFFADPDNGAAAWMVEELEALTQPDGMIKRREQALERQRELLADRVDVLNERLDRKRERLTRQFLAMEQTLSQLQSQQNALAQFAAAGSGFGQAQQQQQRQ